MKDLLRIADLSPEDLRRLLAMAGDAEREPHAWRDLLAGEIVVAFFAEPSTRTRLSLGAAVARLGGALQAVGPDDLHLGRGESIEDTARVVSRYATALFVRTVADHDFGRFAAASTIPVVNALTLRHHPLQALADLLTLQQRFGELAGLKLAYLGDGSNVCHSLLEACALAGIDITVATPPGYEPDQDVVDVAQHLAIAGDSIVRTTHDPYLAAMNADAVYTDTWLSMGVDEASFSTRAAALAPYRVDAAIMGMAADHAVFLHCLPAHRADEVTPGIIDGPHSAVFDQAANRLHTTVALLRSLVLGLLTDSAALVATSRR